MGVLKDRVEVESGGNIPQYYKENVNLLTRRFQKPGEEVKPIPASKMSDGQFYFLVYHDESNWMQYSPIFFIDWKEFGNKIIGYGVNFNFIPFEMRLAFFDKIVTSLLDEDQFTGINFESIYKRLLRIGYEYSIVEYDIKRIQTCYHVSITWLPKFLHYSHPKNKYDPQKLYDIWKKKLETKEKRHQEIIKQMASDFYEVTEDIENKYDELKGHLNRVQRNHKKFGS